jgi:diacylglycerol diphosphate phosphatase/phosphatidate phosphatase
VQYSHCYVKCKYCSLLNDSGGNQGHDRVSNVHFLTYCRILGYFSDSFNPHRTFCVYLAGVGLTLLLTDAIKVYVGYLRPIFYDVCVPDEEYQTCTSGDDDDARQSFPSGHSSLSFCGLGLFSFYLEERFGVSKLRESRHHSIVPPSEIDHQSYQTTIGLARIFSILSKSPLLLAGYIATSRIVDNHHFPADVVGGSVLGFSIALWIHNIWNEYL